MAKTETLNLEVKSNIKSVTKDTDKMAHSLDDVNKEAKEGIGNFTLMGVSLNGVKAAFGKVIPMAKTMFGTIKAGIASTGIGLLVIAFGTLVQYFRDSEEGASKFKQITSQLGVVVGNVTDIVSNLGKAVFKLITGDFSGFKEGLKEVTDGVKDFGETTRKEMGMANQLEKDRLALQKFEREAIVEKARTEKEMMELRLKARDFEKFSAEERLKFMREANKLAGEQLEKDLHVAQEKLRFQIEENSYSKSNQQNLDDEAALQAAVFNLERANFSERKRLKSEEQAIVKEIQAANKTAAAAAQKLIDDEWNAKIKANNEWNKEQQKSRDLNTKADKKAADDKEKIEKAKMSMQVGMATQGLQILGDAAGEGTAIAKAAAIAQATISGVQGVQNAFTAANANIGATAGSFGVYPVTMAALAGTFAAMNIAKIASGGGGGGVTPPSIPTPTAQTPAPQMMSGSFDLTGGQAVEPTRAYVVSDDITSSQDGLAIIRRRATI